MKTLLQVVMTTLALGLLAGCTQGGAQDNGALQNQVTQLTNQLQAMQTQLNSTNAELAALRSQAGGQPAGASGGSAPALRVGFVNAEEVFVKFRGTEEAIQAYRLEKEQTETELRTLTDRYSAGAISQNEYNTRQIQLQTKLAELDQQLTNDITQKIVEAVEAIGRDAGYDLITVRKNVVLYYREDGFVHDLTETVLAHMNDQLGQGGN